MSTTIELPAQTNAPDFSARAFSLRDLAGMELKPPEERVANMLYEGETVALVGKPKTGKTRLAYQLAVSVASGTPFLGQAILKPGRVLYIELESPPYRARERFAQVAGSVFDDVQDRVRLYSVPTFADSRVGLHESGLRVFQQLLDAEPTDLLILDPWRYVILGDENEARDTVKSLTALNTLRRHYPRLSILILHHLSKRTPAFYKQALRGDPQTWLDDVSGSHAFTAHTDATFGFEREDDRYVLAGIRRYGEAPTLILDSDPNTLRFEPLSDLAERARLALTPKQFEVWNLLPAQFDWSAGLAKASGSRKLLHNLTQNAIHNGLLAKEDGFYVKAA